MQCLVDRDGAQDERFTQSWPATRQRHGFRVRRRDEVLGRRQGPAHPGVAPHATHQPLALIQLQLHPQPGVFAGKRDGVQGRQAMSAQGADRRLGMPSREWAGELPALTPIVRDRQEDD